MSIRFETSSQHVWLDAEGILHAETKPGSAMDLNEAKEIIRQVRAVSNGIARPVIVDLSGVKQISRDARIYFAGPETAEVESAAALTVSSPMSRVIGNFFMGLNRSFVPTRLFTSAPLAMEWLRQYLPPKAACSSQK